MATYYRWRKSTIKWENVSDNHQLNDGEFGIPLNGDINYYQKGHPNSSTLNFNENTGKYSLSSVLQQDTVFVNKYLYLTSNNYMILTGEFDSDTRVIENKGRELQILIASSMIKFSAKDRYPIEFYIYQAKPTASTSQGYVYSTSSSAYPNGGVSGSYYYDQRTTETSPTVASNLTYPESIDVTSSSSVQLQWTGAQSNTDYPVTEYEISYAINNTDSWQVAGTTGVLTYEFSSIPEEATSIAFRVRAKDSNNQYGDYITGTYSTISREPPITVVTKNIEMNYFNGTDYEILYPVVGSEVYNHVKSGNYVGSGQYGQSNPNKLELEFTPKVAMITKTTGVYDAYLLNGKTVSYVQSSSGVSEITVEWTGQTVSWYSTDSVEAQLNENGVLYAYVVFG